MKLDLTGTVFWAVVIVCLLGAKPGGAQVFRWKFSEGDQFRVVLSQTTSVETSVDRRTVEQKTQMDLSLDWKVVAIDAQEHATIEQAFRRIKATLTMPDEQGTQRIEFDTDLPEDVVGRATRLRDSFQPLLNHTVSLKVSSRGEVLDVTIPKETLESLREMPGSMQARELFSAESLRETFMQALFVFPEAELNLDETWTHSSEFELGKRTYRRANTYTYQGPVDEAAGDHGGDVFSVKSELEVSSDASTDQPSLQIVEQQGEGRIVFDQQAGNCRQSDYSLSLTTLVPYRDMEVRSTVTTDLSMSIQRQPDDGS